MNDQLARLQVDRATGHKLESDPNFSNWNLTPISPIKKPAAKTQRVFDFQNLSWLKPVKDQKVWLIPTATRSLSVVLDLMLAARKPP